MGGRTKTTVLDGYYATGDHECFCFDRLPSPDAYLNSYEDDEERYKAQDRNRVYPGDLLPERRRLGKWTIVVTFEPQDVEP